MTDDIFNRMRNSLQPGGTAPVVRLSFTGSSAAFFHKDFVHNCIDLLEKKTMLAAAGLEPLNDLEKLACHLLMDSAYIEFKRPDPKAGTL